MLYKVLDKQDFKNFLTNLISNYELIGPKIINKALDDFVPIKNIDQLDLNYKRTTLPPAKKILFPSSEELISYKLGDKIEVNPSIKSERKILFGVNAWDINGINFLDKIFTTDYIDDNYVSKRKNLIVIGYDTEPAETNFSIKMGAEYAKEGFDLYISDLGSKYFIRVSTPTGSEILEKFAKVKDASTLDFNDYDKFLDNYRKKFKVKVDMNNFYDNFASVYGNEKLWEKFSKSCYSCGSCNLVCPTCFCFNVKDEVLLNLKAGRKSREWDSCMIPDYGLVAGGHNFRPTRSNRLKQRYQCKLKTFVDKYGSYSCVGCGRCVEACLAKINIYEDINSIKEEVNV